MRSLTKRRARPLAASPHLPFPVSLLASVLPSFVLPLLPPYACFATRRPLQRTHTRALSKRPSRASKQPTMSAPSFTPTSQRRPPDISLSLKENQVFDVLRAVVTEEYLSGLTLRVAGGWVRDKVMGTSTARADIDIAMNKYKGAEFAEMINAWLTRKGYEARHIGVIQRNPAQSKHLETATMRVLDVELDLVNLRTEEYADGSRIPEMTIGTPEEDALRRDLTINALFYNLSTEKVEDFTGRGLDDIDARIIRTPLEPLTTLLDDPLRALRVIRFAARLNFQMDPALYEAIKQPSVHTALRKKVSQERITSELNGMMLCDHAFHALGLLIETGLFRVIFSLPPDDVYTCEEKRPPPDFETQALNAVYNMERMWFMSGKHGKQEMEDNPLVRSVYKPADPRCARYAAMLLPIATVFTRGKKGRVESAANYVLKRALKLSNKDVEKIERIHEAARRFKDIVRNPELNSRLASGRILRETREEWEQGVQILLARRMNNAKPPTLGYMGGVTEESLEMLRQDCNEELSFYISFSTKISSYGLNDVWNWRPLVDGKALLRILPRLPRGPEVGAIQKRQIDWMIEHHSPIAHLNVNVEKITQLLLEHYPQYAPE